MFSEGFWRAWRWLAWIMPVLLIVAKVFTGSDGVQVPLEKTIASFKAVVAGEYDHLPEAAFYMVGDIEEVKAKAQRLAAAAA